MLDCEGVHAKWHWIDLMKRGVSFNVLNAILKIQDYLRSHGELPGMRELSPRIETTLRAYNSQLSRAGASGEVAVEMRSSWMYFERFNLNLTQVDLIKASVGPKEEAAQTPTAAWGMYLRFLIVPLWVVP